jgi:hypothetical protein
MKWTIEYLEKDGIVAAKINGIMDWEEHRKFAEELYPFARKKGSNRIVIDFREMIPDFTVLQIDDLPKLLKKLGVGPDIKIAAIFDPSSPKANEHTFFRNVATIISLRVELFSDRKEAIAWLKVNTKTEKPARKH